jgi:hypothetical protein
MISTMGGAPTHALREYRGNGEAKPGAFTRGNRGSWGKIDNRPAVLAQDVRFAGLRLTDRVPVVQARRPYGDMPDARVKVISKIKVCPGCGLVPPRGVKCNGCWE